ncbi:efflux RND transporter periplasmic adaptor subunit [Rhizobium paknamense]|uniref:Multidrug efflux system membrane fusion protein n=1 Tax=Rhizobium paknamense TaxID=1206817 RepID=A0ABU0IBN8_9HYPH|nr:efflux RND transporter periplasmic adaptor subunit [Rhizobium paknamense]MDQ0455643.1 multidrug efflux system membrane fusion protein [Rhizobium paknamense]
MTARIKKTALWGAGLGTVLVLMAGVASLNITNHAEAASAAAPPQAIPVTVTSVQPRSVQTWHAFSGRLEAVDRVEIRSRVAGVVQSVHFPEGGLVKAGDLMVSIDPEPYQAAVSQAEGDVASAEAKLELATTELERGKTLFSRNTISESEQAQRQSNYRAAIAALKSAEAARKVAELNLGYTEIRAPISGRAGRLEVTAGNLVAAGSTSQPLTTLVSIDPIYANFDVSEDLLLRTLALLPAKDGRAAIDRIPVEITPQDGSAPVEGRMQLIDNEVNTASGTIKVRAVFANPEGRLMPGQFVRIRMGQPKAEERLLVSERAVGTDQDKKYVFVVDQENKVAYRQIELGAAVEGGRIVENGLKAGERIVVNGLQRIRPGATVQPQEQTAAN